LKTSAEAWDLKALHTVGATEPLPGTALLKPELLKPELLNVVSGQDEQL
jgi:hypothetical protein